MIRGVGRVDLAASCGLFLASIAIRALSLPTVLLGQGGPTFFGNDAYYHARRIWYSVVHFPAVLDRDPYMNFPDGGQPIWTPTFDWLIAGGVRLLPGQPDQQTMEAWIVWIPPVLGALTVVALYFLALRYFGRNVALLSGLILALLPAHFWYSQLGFVDHHVAVALITTALLAATMSSLAHGPAPGGGRRAVYLGASLAACLWVWPGCLLQVLIVEVGLAIRFLSSDRREHTVAWGRLFALANGVAFLLVLPLGFGSDWDRWGTFSPLVASEFQPLLFGLTTLWFWIISEAWNRLSFPESAFDRALQGLFVSGILAGLSLIVFSDFLNGLEDSWNWLAKEETFQASVGESKALFQDGRTRPEEFLTRAVYLAPLLLAFFWGRVRRRQDRPAYFFLLGWTTALAVLALLQMRFANSFSVVWSLLLAWSLVEVTSGARRRFSARPRARAFALVMGSVLLIVAVWPSVTSYRSYALNIGRVMNGEPPKRNFLEHLHAVRKQMSRWIRDNTEPTQGWLDETQRPEYGILAPWSAGHVLKYESRRPVIQDNFGDDAGTRGFEAAQGYFRAESERDALAQIDGMGARYIIVRSNENRSRANRFPGEMQTRLEKYRGSEQWMVAKRGNENPMGFTALERHRLIYESLARRPTGDQRDPMYQLFEIVPGAIIEGQASPGQWVLARLEVRPQSGASFDYLHRARADASGHWQMRVPYSNEPFSSAVEVAPTYELSSGEDRVTFSVPEAAVRSGGRVAAPQLGSDS